MMEYDKTIIESDNLEPKKNSKKDVTKSIPKKQNKTISAGATVGIGVGAVAAGAVVTAAMPHFTFGQENGNPVTVDSEPINDQESQDENNELGQDVDSGVENHSHEVSDLPVATCVTDDMTPSEAFAAAREEVGPGGIYYYHGHAQGTYYESEWNSMSNEEKEDYWASVYHTHEQYQQQQDEHPQQEEYGVDEIGTVDEESTFFVVDANGNEIPDVVVDLDNDGVGDVLMMDVEVENDEVVSVGETYVGEFFVESNPVEEELEETEELTEMVEDDGELMSDLYVDYDITANTELDPYINIDNNVDVSDMV